jgi:hypothetical protein
MQIPVKRRDARLCAIFALATIALGLAMIAPAHASPSGNTKAPAGGTAKAMPNPGGVKAIRDHRRVQSCGPWIKDPARCPQRPYRP